VLVSEVMLQQTQVERVLPYYRRWLDRWPDAASLAAASPAEVIGAWSGLGYNRRALNLHRAAAAIVERHDGAVPPSPDALRVLPGIGPYTANAVATFAFEQPVTVVEANIGRLLARLLLGTVSAGSVPPRALEAAAASLLPEQGVRDHNLALMDLGAMVCTARNPGCLACPVLAHCAWYAAGRPAGERRARAAAVRFEDTARFARGRIVEALRSGVPLTAAQLRGKLPVQHHAALDAYLAALARDGLIVESAGRWALPGS
jgi:A/G-specific adenine glycosylase